jgi:hypothetical protein
MDEKDSWLSGVIDFRPMCSNIIENGCDDLFGSPIYVNGEGLDVYRLLMHIPHMLDVGLDEDAIFGTIEGLE